MTSIITPDWPAPANVVAATTTRHTPDSALPPDVRYLHQVHGATVVPIERVRATPAAIDADAVTGARPGDICAVRTADCLPLLFCASDGTEIAAAHAGWRGVRAGIIESTVAALETDPSDLLVWLGPAISQAAFEVGDEVRDALLASDPGSEGCFEPNERRRWQADLYGLARRRLRRCGVTAVYGGRWCTVGDEQRFWSYRRAADTARMVSYIQLK